MKANKVLLNITSVFCFLFGACYIFSLVFIPVGIYCFVAGRLFSHKADHLLDNYVSDKKTMKAYTIFASIACFPFGCLSIIAFFGIYGNNVKVEKSEVINFNIFDAPEADEEIKEVKSEEIESEPEKEESVKEETEEEKMEKLEKLRKFKEKNIITEEEFEMAKEQIFGKDKK